MMNECRVDWILTDRIPDNDNSPLVYYREDELKVEERAKRLDENSHNIN